MIIKKNLSLVLKIYALSFYRSQNVLCCSKFFEPAQKFIYTLCQLQTFCARQKDDLHSVKLVFVPAQNVLKSFEIFGLAQNIWTTTKHFGTCKRTRHKSANPAHKWTCSRDSCGRYGERTS